MKRDFYLIFLALVLGISAIMVLAACEADTAGGLPSRTSQPTGEITRSTSPPPQAEAKRNAVTAYLGMWRNFAAAGATSNWQDPALARYATGTALTNLTRGLYADHMNGLVTKGSPILNPTVAAATPPSEPTKVIITDCGDSTSYLKYTTGGQPAPDGPGGRQLIRATVQKQSDGSWKVTDFGIQGVGTC